MFLSNPVKFFLSGGLFLFSFTGCGWWRSADNGGTAEVVETRNQFPFPSREPDIFQAEVIVSTGGIERKTFVAQNGQRRRVDYDVDGPRPRTILYGGGNFIVAHHEKIYAEMPRGGRAQAEDSPMARLANSRIYTTIAALGEEEGLARFVAKMDERASSEVLIFVDQALGMPVRQEFYSIEDGNRTLTYSVEFRNIKLEAEDALFEVPKNFRSVPYADFNKIIKRN